MDGDYVSEDFMGDEEDNGEKGDYTIDGFNMSQLSERSRLFNELDQDLKDIMKVYLKEHYKLVKVANKKTEVGFAKLERATKNRKYKIVRQDPAVSEKQREVLDIFRILCTHPTLLDEDGEVKPEFPVYSAREQLFEYCVQGQPWTESDDKALLDGLERFGIAGLPDIISESFPVQTVKFIVGKICDLVDVEEEEELEEKYPAFCKKQGIACLQEIPVFDAREHRLVSGEVRRARHFFTRWQGNYSFLGMGMAEGFVNDPYEFLMDYFTLFDEESQLVNGWEWMEQVEKMRTMHDVTRLNDHASVETRWRRMKKHCKGIDSELLDDRKRGDFKDGHFKGFWFPGVEEDDDDNDDEEEEEEDAMVDEEDHIKMKDE